MAYGTISAPAFSANLNLTAMLPTMPWFAQRYENSYIAARASVRLQRHHTPTWPEPRSTSSHLGSYLVSGCIHTIYENVPLTLHTNH